VFDNGLKIAMGSFSPVDIVDENFLRKSENAMNLNLRRPP